MQKFKKTCIAHAKNKKKIAWLMKKIKKTYIAKTESKKTCIECKKLKKLASPLQKSEKTSKANAKFALPMQKLKEVVYIECELPL